MDKNKGPKIDRGRLAAVPVMALLGGGNLAVMWRNLTDMPSGTLEVATLVRNVLMVAFYLLIVGFYLVRTSARATTSSVPARALAVVATFLPFGIPLVLRPVDDLPILTIANLLLCSGLAWSVWSLRHLGRSVSIVAQARTLVRSGPYRLVRHPLYAGELLATLGVVLTGVTLPAAAMLGALVALQVYRASKEEQVLADAFPEYAEYRVGTSRLVPGLY